MNLAIIIGVEKYQSSSFDDLLACKNDAKVVGEILNDVKDIKETLYINDNEAGYEVKRKISDLIEKYKGEDIDELFFYFTGHGDRYEDDFFYLLSDFDLAKRESTGLRNSEVDDWIKTLSPKLCVKIVDACFSGTQYIKSESNTESELKKSAQKYGLNDIYFWFSSRENQKSFAGKEFSRFTESILTGITEHSGDVRYREIMAYVADDFSNKGDSKPIFITQADNIEKFGHVTKSTHKIIYDAFGLDNPDIETTQQSANNDSIKEKDEVITSVKKELSVFELIKTKSDELCFDEKFLLKFIKSFNEKIFEWDDDLKSIYEIEAEVDLAIYQVPNKSEIGIWLEKNKSKNYFAEATSDESTYQVEEYKALPKKPAKNTLTRIRAMGLWGEEENTEYKLETVNKIRSYISGFNYTHYSENRISRISFKPKIELAQPLTLHIVPIYSNKHMVLHIAYEVLKRNDWKSFSQPKCLSWKMIQTNIDSKISAESVSSKIKTEIKLWIEGLLANSI